MKAVKERGWIAIRISSEEAHKLTECIDDYLSMIQYDGNYWDEESIASHKAFDGELKRLANSLRSLSTQEHHKKEGKR